MSAIKDFDDWFKKLSEMEQKRLLNHIKEKYFTESITEGYYGGPPGCVERGIFAGPASANARCPTCGRLY